ncbi:hypothetical protein DVH05_010464 [Phytophthora capsici]|nr:hypothetical protein DVH05_010464 [Phytophthora capsici]
MPPKALQGRVFDLWRHFQALPTELQGEVTRIQTLLLTPEVKKQLLLPHVSLPYRVKLYCTSLARN